jgi:hypothetical protein
MIKLHKNSATVDFSIFTKKSKNILVTAGAFAYLQKQLFENSGYSIDSFKKELSTDFGFKESTVESVISFLVENGFIKLCEDVVQNCLTNDPDMSRITSVPIKDNGSRVQVKPREENNNYILSDSSFRQDSPLIEIKELIIDWWNNYKGGAKTRRSWALQANEFKKIYEDKTVRHDIEAIKMAVENAIAATENSTTKKNWQAINYQQWVVYSKERWIQYKNIKDKTDKSGRGDLVVSDSGAWLGQLKIPNQLNN